MNRNNLLDELVLRSDKEWEIVDGELCRVIDFNPLALNKTRPYAYITIECKKLNKLIKGYITHRIDFKLLLMVFKERGIRENEEVLIFWTKKHYKLKPLRLLHIFLPKLRVMVCQKGAFELMTDLNYKPELQGEARFNAERPIVSWKPEIME